MHSGDLAEMEFRLVLLILWATGKLDLPVWLFVLLYLIAGPVAFLGTSLGHLIARHWGIVG